MTSERAEPVRHCSRSRQQGAEKCSRPVGLGAVSIGASHTEFSRKGKERWNSRLGRRMQYKKKGSFFFLKWGNLEHVFMLKGQHMGEEIKESGELMPLMEGLCGGVEIKPKVGSIAL